MVLGYQQYQQQLQERQGFSRKPSCLGIRSSVRLASEVR